MITRGSMDDFKFSINPFFLILLLILISGVVLVPLGLFFIIGGRTAMGLGLLVVGLLMFGIIWLIACATHGL